VRWEKIKKHRKAARKISFDILIWGPSQTDREGYKLRFAIKKHLANKGHSVKFSEELITERDVPPAPDPVTDEMFHADAANIIIVLYGSRGTQTEFDKILKYEAFARKSVIVVDKATWDLVTKRGLAGYSWKNFNGETLILLDSQMNARTICSELDKLVEKFQFSEYLKRLEKRLIKTS